MHAGITDKIEGHVTNRTVTAASLTLKTTATKMRQSQKATPTLHIMLWINGMEMLSQPTRHMNYSQVTTMHEQRTVMCFYWPHT